MSQQEAREIPAEPSFDLSAFEAADVGVLEVQTPAGEPLLHQGRPVRIHLYGPGSAEYTRAQARADAAAQARTFAAIRGKAAKNATEEQREDAINKLAGVELVDPNTLVTVVRYVERNSDFHRLARVLETFVND